MGDLWYRFSNLTKLIFWPGPMATGKSSTILKLAGQFIHHEKVYPTPGVEVTVVYWPMKNVMSEDVLLFRLEFWEAGSIAVSRYGYIEEMIHEENSPADAICKYLKNSS